MDMISKSMTLAEILQYQGKFVVPNWQRDYIWDFGRRQKLWDTILSGWKLPKFYFWKKDDGPDLYVVDGQQRLTTIANFLRNQYLLTDENVKKFNLMSRSFATMPEASKERILGFRIEYDEITNATENEIREFFQRLQQGVQLTGFEKLNAASGELRDFCKDLTHHPFFVERVNFANRRQSHLAIAARVMAVALCGRQVSLRAEELLRIFGLYKTFSGTTEQAVDIRHGLDFLAEAFPEKTEGLNHKVAIQSIINLAADFAARNGSAGLEKAFGVFATDFFETLASMDEDSQPPDQPYLGQYLRSMRDVALGEAELRQDALMQFMAAKYPVLTTVLGHAESTLGFNTMVRSKALLAWGTETSAKFAERLSEKRMMAQIPNAVIRQNLLATYVGIYEGRQKPIDRDGLLTRDAVAIASLVGMTSQDIEKTIPSIKGEMIYTDTFRKWRSDLARIMRLKAIFTFKALEKYTGERFSPEEQAVIIKILSTDDQFRYNNGNLLVRRLEQAIQRAGETPAIITLKNDSSLPFPRALTPAQSQGKALLTAPT